MAPIDVRNPWELEGTSFLIFKLFFQKLYHGRKQKSIIFDLSLTIRNEAVEYEAASALHDSLIDW